MNTVCKEHEWVSVDSLPDKDMKVRWLCIDGVEDIGFFYKKDKTFRTIDRVSDKEITHWKQFIDFHIKENLDLINKQQWEDIFTEFQKYGKGERYDNELGVYAHFYQWLIENYDPPTKK